MLQNARKKERVGQAISKGMWQLMIFFEDRIGDIIAI